MASGSFWDDQWRLGMQHKPSRRNQTMPMVDYNRSAEEDVEVLLAWLATGCDERLNTMFAHKYLQVASQDDILHTQNIGCVSALLDI